MSKRGRDDESEENDGNITMSQEVGLMGMEGDQSFVRNTSIRTSEQPVMKHFEVYCVPALSGILLVPEDATPETSLGYFYCLLENMADAHFDQFPRFSIQSNPIGYVAPMMAGGSRAGFNGSYFPNLPIALIRDLSFRMDHVMGDHLPTRLLNLGWVDTDAFTLFECELILAAKEIVQNPGIPQAQVHLSEMNRNVVSPVPSGVLKSWLMLAGERLEQQGILSNVELSLSVLSS